MADKKDKHPDNVPGKFYVDNTCTDCAACRDTAPGNFSHNNDKGYSFVSKQPENDKELQLCVEAMDSCPNASIGNDGDN